MNQEPLPQIHLIRDTDLSVFAYELHIFAGDFLRECEFNMRSLATNTGADSIAIMGKIHIWLSDACLLIVLRRIFYQMISTTEFIGARAFLFHTDRREGGHLYGDVLMMDLDTLRQDIKRNILYPCGVNIERKEWFSGYGQPERMDWNGALRKRCSEKLGIFLCPESSYGMAVPLFHDVQTVDGSGISLYAPGFRRTPEYAIYGGSPEPGYG